MVHLPNTKYYDDIGRASTHDLSSTIRNILVYALLESLTLLYVYYRAQRSLGVSVFYQLAFALEREWRLYQTNIIEWILYVVQYLVRHNGVN
uniref:Uncharacterized protein n=1 Tax=Globisporangium ultimum (strain ATCC 200006 / CBS 805.95 / DAOM BR144) TaxID=431595 RepID=K3WJE2_GLOUD